MIRTFFSRSSAVSVPTILPIPICRVLSPASICNNIMFDASPLGTSPASPTTTGPLSLPRRVGFSVGFVLLGLALFRVSLCLAFCLLLLHIIKVFRLHQEQRDAFLVCTTCTPSESLPESTNVTRSSPLNDQLNIRQIKTLFLLLAPTSTTS